MGAERGETTPAVLVGRKEEGGDSEPVLFSIIQCNFLASLRPAYLGCVYFMICHDGSGSRTSQ